MRPLNFSQPFWKAREESGSLFLLSPDASYERGGMSDSTALIPRKIENPGQNDPPRRVYRDDKSRRDEPPSPFRSLPHSLSIAPSPLNRVPLATRAVQCATSLRHRSVEANAKFSRIIVLPGAHPSVGSQDLKTRGARKREVRESPSKAALLSPRSFSAFFGLGMRCQGRRGVAVS